jgi:hypothetical protein
MENPPKALQRNLRSLGRRKAGKERAVPIKELGIAQENSGRKLRKRGTCLMKSGLRRQ